MRIQKEEQDKKPHRSRSSRRSFSVGGLRITGGAKRSLVFHVQSDDQDEGIPLLVVKILHLFS